jgi:hypothetical protein
LGELIDPHLPVPLAAAVREFDAWMLAELRSDEARSTPQEPLYHYTGEAALRGIIESQRLWCFIHNRQKDQEEVKFSLKVARQAIREEVHKARPHSGSLLSGLDGMLDAVFDDQRFDFYFSSFTSHRDDASQWTEYGDQRRGFAIGFSPCLFQPDQKQLLPFPADNVFVGKVIYGKDAILARHRRGIRKLAEITERVARANPSLVQRCRQSWFDNLNHAFIATSLIWNCLTAKCSQYLRERETRFVILGVRSIFDPCRKQHNGRAYVETPLRLSEPGNLAEILVGPDAPWGAEAMTRNLLRSHGYSDAVGVDRSAAGS